MRTAMFKLTSLLSAAVLPLPALAQSVYPFGDISKFFETSAMAVVATVAAAVVATGAGVLASFFAERQKRLELEKLKQIQRTIYVKLAEQQSKSIDDISGRCPERC
jgi:hypothetical protein